MKFKLLRVYYYIIEFIKEVWLRPTLFIISVLLFYFSFDIPNEKIERDVLLNNVNINNTEYVIHLNINDHISISKLSSIEFNESKDKIIIRVSPNFKTFAIIIGTILSFILLIVNIVALLENKYDLRLSKKVNLKFLRTKIENGDYYYTIEDKLIYKSDVFLTPKFLFDNNDFKYSELKNYPNFYTKEEKRTKKLKKILK